MATTGEKVDRAVTYGLLIKEIFSSLIKNPTIQTKLTEELMKVAKGGRTRTDEMFFFTSLVKLENVSPQNKQLFLQKHYELLNPDFYGKTPEEILGLKKKEKLAKGLVFLIAEDKTIADPNSAKRFQYAKEIWYGIFLDIDKLPDDNTKLQILEQRILHFGKNNQESMTISEIGEKLKGWNEQLKPAEEYQGPIHQLKKTFKKIFGK